MQQKKQTRLCPGCEAPLKRNRGCQSRKWFWICTKGGESCYKAPVTS
jgi:hypothetical protein